MDDSHFANLEELIKAIDMALDIVFSIGGEEYNISPRNYKSFIALCPDGEAIFYENGSDLVNHHKIKGIVLKDLLEKIEIISM